MFSELGDGEDACALPPNHSSFDQTRGSDIIVHEGAKVDRHHCQGKIVSPMSLESVTRVDGQQIMVGDVVHVKDELGDLHQMQVVLISQLPHEKKAQRGGDAEPTAVVELKYTAKLWQDKKYNRLVGVEDIQTIADMVKPRSDIPLRTRRAPPAPTYVVPEQFHIRRKVQPSLPKRRKTSEAIEATKAGPTKKRHRAKSTEAMKANKSVAVSSAELSGSSDKEEDADACQNPGLSPAEDKKAEGPSTEKSQWCNRSHDELSTMLSGILKSPASVKRRQLTGCLSFEEFHISFHMATMVMGGIEAMEATNGVKGQKYVRKKDVTGSQGSTRTMYGAIRPEAVDMLVREAEIKAEDVFFDVGAGLGTVMLQLAVTVGCRAMGVEIVASRLAAGVAITNNVFDILKDQGCVEEDSIERMRDRNVALEGDVRNYFEEIKRSTVIYVNNVGSWLHDPMPKIRGKEMGTWSIHQRVCACFAQSTNGTRLITLEKVPPLHAGWAEHKVITCPGTWFSWSTAPWFRVFIYKKVSDTWTCHRCKHETRILDSDNMTFTLHCAKCNALAAGAVRPRAQEHGAATAPTTTGKKM